jgi:hypothetical protein
VQAFLLLSFIDQKNNQLTEPSPEAQQQALVASLSRVLLLVAGNEPRHVVVCDATTGHHATRKGTNNFNVKESLLSSTSEQLKFISGMTMKGGFSTRAALEGYLAEILADDNDDDDNVEGGDVNEKGGRPPLGWCAPYGPGLMCLIASLLLTRNTKYCASVRDPSPSFQSPSSSSGPTAIKGPGPCVAGGGGAATLATSIAADMDMDGPLIVEHGYCSQELVNLMLQGRGTSNVHDGTVVSGGGNEEVEEEEGIKLHGLFGPLEVGCLSYLEHRRLIKVGQAAKAPVHPVWVVHYESHYSTLFMKADVRSKAALQQGVSLLAFEYPRIFDLFFYDQQGQQDEEVRLTITLDPAPLPPVPKDALVPYLNEIVRTVPEWARARVNWNGTDPLL